MNKSMQSYERRYTRATSTERIVNPFHKWNTYRDEMKILVFNNNQYLGLEVLNNKLAS